MLRIGSSLGKASVRRAAAPKVMTRGLSTRSKYAMFEVGMMMKSKGERVGGSVSSVGVNDSVADAIKKMENSNMGSMVVNDGNHVAGIITERDFIRKLDTVVQGGNVVTSVKCSDIMTSNPAVVTPQSTLDQCVNLMMAHNCRHLPVVTYIDEDHTKKNDVIGMISVRDVVAQVYALLAGSAEVNKTLSSMSAADLLADRPAHDGVHDIREDASMHKAVQMMQTENVGSIIVMSSNQMTGIVTERDYLRKVIAAGMSDETVTVGNAMTKDPICITPDYSFHQVAQLFVTKGFRHLPVMDFIGDSNDNDSRPVNILSVKDIIAACVSLGPK